HHVSGIAPTSYVQLVVDHAEGEPTRWMRERYRPRQISPRVGPRIIRPCVGLRTGHLPSVIPADNIDPPCSRNVPASREATHIGHVRTSRPRVGCYVVDARDVVVGPAHRVFTPKHIDLVRRRIVRG